MCVRHTGQYQPAKGGRKSWSAAWRPPNNKKWRGFDTFVVLVDHLTLTIAWKSFIPRDFVAEEVTVESKAKRRHDGDEMTRHGKSEKADRADLNDQKAREEAVSSQITMTNSLDGSSSSKDVLISCAELEEALTSLSVTDQDYLFECQGSTRFQNNKAIMLAFCRDGSRNAATAYNLDSNAGSTAESNSE